MRLPISPAGSQGGLGTRGKIHAFDRDEIFPVQIFAVIDRRLASQPVFHGCRGAHLFNPFCDAKDEGITAVSVTGEKDPVSGLCLFQRRRQHQEYRGGSGIPDLSKKRILNLSFLEAQPLCQFGLCFGVGGIEDDFGKITGAKPNTSSSAPR